MEEIVTVAQKKTSIFKNPKFWIVVVILGLIFIIVIVLLTYISGKLFKKKDEPIAQPVKKKVSKKKPDEQPAPSPAPSKEQEQIKKIEEVYSQKPVAVKVEHSATEEKISESSSSDEQQVEVVEI